MARAKPRSHPLRLFFQSQRYTDREGMNWLQDRGHISDECVDVEDVAPRDVQRILGLAQAHWAWSEPPWHIPEKLSDYANINSSPSA